MAERAVGLARHAGEVGLGDRIADKRADHLDGDLGIGPAGESGDRPPASSRGQASRHVEAAVAGEPASVTSTKSSGGASPRVETCCINLSILRVVLAERRYAAGTG